MCFCNSTKNSNLIIPPLLLIPHPQIHILQNLFLWGGPKTVVLIFNCILYFFFNGQKNTIFLFQMSPKYYFTFLIKGEHTQQTKKGGGGGGAVRGQPLNFLWVGVGFPGGGGSGQFLGGTPKKGGDGGGNFIFWGFF